MAKESCDGCGKRVKIGGGLANLWIFDHRPTEGMTLELTDGSEHFLCYDCINRLPDDREPVAEDVAALEN